MTFVDSIHSTTEAWLGDHSSDFGPQRPIFYFFRTEESKSRIVLLLEQCDIHHSKCKCSHPLRRPRRLLRIGIKEQINQLHISGYCTPNVKRVNDNKILNTELLLGKRPRAQIDNLIIWNIRNRACYLRVAKNVIRSHLIELESWRKIHLDRLPMHLPGRWEGLGSRNRGSACYFRQCLYHHLCKQSRG